MERANIILLRLDGVGVATAAERLKTTSKRVSLWSGRFERSGLDGLDDKPGRGRKPSIPNAKVARVVTEATRPPQGKTRWSIRSMSRHAGVSPSTVQRIWSKNDLKPHRLKTFKLSNDPKFEEKFRDVIGLYLDPPTKALVLCCDEKSQCQALERTQLGLPLAPNRTRTMTHDYMRHGTVMLFAALVQLSGKLIARTEASHTHVEWLRFLKQIDGPPSGRAPPRSPDARPGDGRWCTATGEDRRDTPPDCCNRSSSNRAAYLGGAAPEFFQPGSKRPGPDRSGTPPW
jgi:transposase